jgi:hypothetical protein
MFDAAFKFQSGLFIHYNAIYNTISIISVNMTLRHKYKQIKIILKQNLIFFFEK